MKSYGQVAYEGFHAADKAEGKFKALAFSELEQATRDAWVVAGCAVAKAVETELCQIPKAMGAAIQEGGLDASGN